MKTHILGFPRIGQDRELKKHWSLIGAVIATSVSWNNVDADCANTTGFNR